MKIPDGLRTIGEMAFAFTQIAEVAIPPCVTVKCGAFKNCGRLKRVAISEGVETLEPGALEGCTSLKHIVFPDTITSLLPDVLKGCSALESVVLGRRTGGVAATSLDGCGALKRITCFAPCPPEAEEGAFKDLNKNACVLCVPYASMEKYARAEGWRQFKNITGIFGE